MGYENRSNTPLNNQASIDPIYSNLNFNEHAYDARTGLYISSNDFYIGVSATSLLSQAIEANNSITNFSTIYLSSGFTKSIVNGDIPPQSLIPALMYSE